MKSITILFFLLFLTSHWVKAQEFEFLIFFEDNAGNRDSLRFGYDKSATDSIDEQFGERNIIDSTLNNNLDVRFSDFLQNTYKQLIPLSFQTKKQITVKDNYGYWSTVSTIEIKCKNWPVTASWDPSLFEDEKFNGSLFSSWYPGGWFDCSSGYSNLSVVFLKDQDEVVFTKNYADGYVDEYEDYGNKTSYLNAYGDSISLYWIVLANSSIVGLREKENEQLKLFPNPANDCLDVNNLHQSERFDKCIIY